MSLAFEILANRIPLYFDATQGLPAGLHSSDTLLAPGPLQVAGGVGFYGSEPVAEPPTLAGAGNAGAGNAGAWPDVLAAIVRALVDLGLVLPPVDGWDQGLVGLSGITAVGPYENGRLLVGGKRDGWLALDPPQAALGSIQALTANANGVGYDSILTLGPQPPLEAPPLAALWYDTASSTLKVHKPSGWSPAAGAGAAALAALLDAAHGNAAVGSLVVADGSGGLDAVPGPVVPSGESAGAGLVADAAGQPSYQRQLFCGARPPWPNGGSAYASGRPVGVDQAIWLDTTPQAEGIRAWDEVSRRWLGTPASNPVIDGLAALRGRLAPGDLLACGAGSSVEPLPAGSPGQALVMSGVASDGGRPVWHSRFHRGGSAAPIDALPGDGWLDEAGGIFCVRDDHEWVPVAGVQRFTAANSTGAPAIPGLPVVISANGSGWTVADGRVSPGAVVAICLKAAAVYAPMACGIGGVVLLTPQEWSAVLDPADGGSPSSGLQAGREYFVSARRQGCISCSPDGRGAVLVGSAMSSAHLLLRSGVPPAALSSAV